MIKEFLSSFYEGLSGNILIARRNKPGPDGKVNVYDWFKYPEEFDKAVIFAEKYQNQDLYFSPIIYGDEPPLRDGKPTPLNPITRKKQFARTPENALSTWVVWADADTASPDVYRLNPSIVVQTSKGRYHCYWKLDNSVSVSEASEVAHRLTTAHAEEGSDSNGWSANKVLRIPGSKNTSHGFPEDVKVAYTGEIYALTDISGAYDDVSVVERSYMRPDATDITTPESLPDYTGSLELISSRALELALAEPRAEQDRSRLRYRLLCELMREATINFEQALAIAWNAPASRKWSREDPRGFSGLVAEAGKAQMEVLYESGEGITPVEPDEEGFSVDTHVSLLLPHERKMIEQEYTWIDRYMQHGKNLAPKQNAPYDRINAWTILSLVYSAVGYIPRSNGREPLNLYSMTLGDTTTGKSWSKKLMRVTLDAFFDEDTAYDLGGNASPSALSRKLLERSDMTSWFNKDEAHGALRTWGAKDSWAGGIFEDLAELYDGRVPPQLRTSTWDETGKSANTYFSMHLMGTPDAMIEALNREMFGTGFLARFQWCIGEPRDVTYESMEERDSEETDATVGDPMAKQFIAEFHRKIFDVREKSTYRVAGTDVRIPVKIAPDAAKRLKDAKWQLNQTFKDDKNFDILDPALIRLGVTVRKCATLLALDDARIVVELKDILLALEAAEEWVSNLAIVADKISASDWQRACDTVYDYIVERGGSVERSKVIYKFRAIITKDLEMQISSLIAQGRIKETSGKDARKFLELNKAKEK